MILWVLIAAICGFAFLLLMRVFWAKVQPNVSPTVMWTAAGLFLGSLAVLVAAQRIPGLAAVALGTLPFLRRVLTLARFGTTAAGLFKMFQGAGLGAANSFSQQEVPDTSETSTEAVKMTLDHSSGEMSGTVLNGEFSGRELATLTTEEIGAFYQSLRDDESRRLITVYIQRYHPELAASAESTAEESQQQSPPDSEDQMTPDRAREVLGVHANASDEDIIAAHRRLIQQLHPDRGGSDFLAATINEAKRVLLG